jgi:repressor LexA
MESSLTPKQKQILEWIEEHLRRHHTMPSRREIALGLGLSSPATIQQHIEALEKKGYLKRGESGGSRALQWTARSKRLFSEIEKSQAQLKDPGLENEVIPLLGSIAAGRPIEVYPDARELKVPLELFTRPGMATPKPGETFALTVRGDSMIEDGIHPGDWVILRKADQARNGETVAALLNGEATLKRLHRGKDGYELHPANPAYPVIRVGEEDRFEIQGVLIGMIRRFGPDLPA